MRNHTRALLAGLSIALCVSACGGGGGSGGDDDTITPPPPPPPPPPVGQTFTLSGTITAPDSQTVDSDTNDLGRVAIDNNSPASAQVLPNPVTVGGFINQPGTGAPGRFDVSGDPDDFYRIDMLAGQRITMLVADFDVADADLYLFDIDGNLVDFSIDTGEFESVIAETSGTYFVNATAFAGATNYLLAIGSAQSPALLAAGRQAFTHRDVVPFEAVVRYHEQGSKDAASSLRALEQDMGMQQQAGGAGRERLMALSPGRVSRLQTSKQPGNTAARRDSFISRELQAKWETLLAIKALRNAPGVMFAEPNYRVRPLRAPNDTAFPLQWHYPLISLPEAWDTTTANPGVIVAVVDTGVLADHPDLRGQFVDGYDFVRDADNARDGDGIDNDPSDPGASIGGSSNSFHGTHVSGTIAARGDNSIGVAGVAYDARVMPLRALGEDGGTTYDVDQSLRFAAGLPNDSGTLPAQPADIINLSLGGGAFSQASQNLIRDIRNAGIIVVAAAGNEASASPSYPAAYDGVISVSAVDSQRRLAPYSNFGARIDTAAPGGNNSVDLTGDGYPDGVLSTDGVRSETGLGYVYSFLNGTSMAAPHVAGVLALMKGINPALTPTDIDALLTSGALTEDLGTSGRDDSFGHGLINAQRAVLAALNSIGNSPADNPRLVTSAGTLNFGAATTGLDLVLRNAGSGELQITGIEVVVPWLQITPEDVDGFGLGVYRLTVDRQSLAAGIYATDIDIQSSVNRLSVRAIVSVGSAGAGADVGVVYVLLYDPLEDTTAAQFVSGGSNGTYPFRFENVAPGEYEIIAGSDADNDLFVCDAGEACGAWLTTDQPILLQVDRDITDLDFPVEYQVTLPSISSAEEQSDSPAATRTSATLVRARTDARLRKPAHP